MTTRSSVAFFTSLSCLASNNAFKQCNSLEILVPLGHFFNIKNVTHNLCILYIFKLFVPNHNFQELNQKLANNVCHVCHVSTGESEKKHKVCLHVLASLSAEITFKCGVNDGRHLEHVPLPLRYILCRFPEVSRVRKPAVELGQLLQHVGQLRERGPLAQVVSPAG